VFLSFKVKKFRGLNFINIIKLNIFKLFILILYNFII
jgi:hypothetical protein